MVDLSYTPQTVALPPPEIMEEIVNLYFTHCHNQPYSLFHEETFKIKLAAGFVAPEVQFAILCFATRYQTPLPTPSIASWQRAPALSP
jgi:hypothetical protein